MKTLKSVVLTVVILKSLVGLAHVGHDEPKVLKPLKGGVIQSATDVNVEVVSKDRKLIFYVYNKAMKPVIMNDLQFNVSATNPKTKKTQELVLKATKEGLESEYDSTGLHRYTLNLSVVNKETNAADEIHLVIEPK